MLPTSTTTIMPSNVSASTVLHHQDQQQHQNGTTPLLTQPQTTTVTPITTPLVDTTTQLWNCTWTCDKRFYTRQHLQKHIDTRHSLSSSSPQQPQLIASLTRKKQPNQQNNKLNSVSSNDDDDEESQHTLTQSIHVYDKRMAQLATYIKKHPHLAKLQMYDCAYISALYNNKDGIEEKKKMDHVRQQMLASDDPQDIHAQPQPHTDGIQSSQQMTTEKDQVPQIRASDEKHKSHGQQIMNKDSKNQVNQILRTTNIRSFATKSIYINRNKDASDKKGSTPKRPRGRPPKMTQPQHQKQDHQLATSTYEKEQPLLKRPRGRPPKQHQIQGHEPTSSPSVENNNYKHTPIKRPRGRPPKKQQRAKDDNGENEKEQVETLPIKKPRGRPPKQQQRHETSSSSSSSEAEEEKEQNKDDRETEPTPIKRPRGRPPKQHSDRNDQLDDSPRPFKRKKQSYLKPTKPRIM